MIAPTAWHDCGNTVDRAAHGVNLGITGERGTRKLGMGMAEQDRVDTRNLGETGHRGAIDEPHLVGDLLEASDPQALPFLERLDEVRRLCVS